jgi:hypothetical protein
MHIIDTKPCLLVTSTKQKLHNSVLIASHQIFCNAFFLIVLNEKYFMPQACAIRRDTQKIFTIVYICFHSR